MLENSFPKQSIATGITVDNDRARDLDDAFWVDEDRTGFTLKVAIAGVALLVEKGSRDDELAAVQMHNVYGEEKNPKRSMLPSFVAYQGASLLPERERLVYLFELKYSLSGDLISGKITKSAFISRMKIDFLTFEQAYLGSNHAFHQMIASSVSLASKIWRKRVAKAGMPHWKSAFDLSGNITDWPKEVLAQTVLHEFMVATSAFASQSIGENSNYPLIYRNQGVGPGGPLGRYEIINRGNVKLGQNIYALFTCPIREYVDLVNQRQLNTWIDEKPSIYSVIELFPIVSEANRLEERKNQFFYSPFRHLDIYAFRSCMQSKDSALYTVQKEFRYRLANGMLAFTDIAWCLFSSLSSIESSLKQKILQSLLNNPEAMPKIWEAGINIGCLGLFESRTIKQDENWTCTIKYQSITVKHSSTTANMARANAMVMLGFSLLDIKIGEKSKDKLFLFDMFARSHLVKLCKLMNWMGPNYKQTSLELFEKEMWVTRVEVICSGFVFNSPAIYSSTRKGGELLAAEYSLAQLDSYANALLAEDLKCNGIQLDWIDSQEIQQRPLSILTDICRKFLFQQECSWHTELNSEKIFECTISLITPNQIILGKGISQSRTACLEMAARSVLDQFLRHLS